MEARLKQCRKLLVLMCVLCRPPHHPAVPRSSPTLITADLNCLCGGGDRTTHEFVKVHRVKQKLAHDFYQLHQYYKTLSENQDLLDYDKIRAGVWGAGRVQWP